MKQIPREWTTTEMLANGDAHSIELAAAARATGLQQRFVPPVLLLRSLYELTPAGELETAAPILYPAGAL